MHLCRVGVKTFDWRGCARRRPHRLVLELLLLVGNVRVSEPEIDRLDIEFLLLILDHRVFTV